MDLCAAPDRRARAARTRMGEPAGQLRRDAGFAVTRGARMALRSFVAALALREALARLAGHAAGLSLKWPNDVLLNEGKVAGILLEALGGPNGHLAIGFGVNLIAAPPAGALEPGAVQPVSIRSETGLRLGSAALLDALAEAYAPWEAQLATWGFRPVREAWLCHAARLGGEITARTPRETIRGTFETVDDAGNLVLKTPKGRVSIAAADVFF
jgi:BirA family biotin operon repressor/biotin-[acetyl-CoA-carboxylase] ligase